MAAENVVDTVMATTRARLCLVCGKCTSVCPVSLAGGDYSPRLFVEQIITGSDSPLTNSRLWDCLTCRACSEVCPSSVDYIGMIRDLRAVSPDENCAQCTHGNVIGAWATLMADGATPDRLGWLEGENLRTTETSDTVFFTGCLPLYEPVFEPIGAECLDIARATVRLLNTLGIEPQVLGDEVCCGHDQLWTGDVDTFRKLAERNIHMLQDSGARRIVTACPECAHTLRVEYPQHVGDTGLEVLHLSELLAQQQSPALSKNGQKPRRITYHDPCRLGRYMGVYDAPRDILTKAGFQMVEMQDSGHHATCCGSSLWINCGAVSKNIQVERLQQAEATNAEILVTACPKCQIHFRCALDDPGVQDDIQIEIRDLATLLAETVAGN